MTDERKARNRLDTACVTVYEILQGGDRDPTWHESQELEAAALALAEVLVKKRKGRRK